SRNSSCGRLIMLAARSSRRFIPPEYVPTRRSPASPRSNSASSSSARRRARARPRCSSRPIISRFSRPVRTSSTAASWAVRLTRRLTAVGSASRSCPATDAVPESGRIRVARIFTSVVFPAPFGPSSASTEPVSISRSTPSSTSRLPNDFVIPSAEIVYAIHNCISAIQFVVKPVSADQPNPPPAPLPPGLDLLWGRRSKSRTGPRPELSIAPIVQAAIAIADDEGLEAVSMSRVARALGFTAMSLYRHIDGKDDLLQLMWNASAQGAEQLVLEGEGWRDRMRFWALVQREMLDRHPWITQMPMAAPPMAPNSLHFVERGLEALDETPLSDDERLRVIGLISSYTLSEARMAHDAARALAAPAEADDGPPPSFEALLLELVDEP